MGRNQLGTTGPSLPFSSLPPSTIPDAFPSAPDSCPVLSLPPFLPHPGSLSLLFCLTTPIAHFFLHSSSGHEVSSPVEAAYGCLLDTHRDSGDGGMGSPPDPSYTSRSLSLPHRKFICSLFPRPTSPWGEGTMSLSHFAWKKLEREELRS